MLVHRDLLVLVISVVLGCGVVLADDVASAPSPESVVASLHRGLEALAVEQQSADLGQRFEQLRPVILETHDLAYIAELTIRRRWGDLSESQQQRFLAVFERLSVMTYASRFSSVGANSFKILGSSEQGSVRMQVNAVIQRPSAENLSLDYTLQEREGAWRIINIIADGVSDLALKRAEYRRIMIDGSIDDLIEYIENQTAELP